MGDYSLLQIIQTVSQNAGENETDPLFMPLWTFLNAVGGCNITRTIYGYHHEAELGPIDEDLLPAHRVHERGLGVGHQHKHICVQAELVYPAVQLCRNICPRAKIERAEVKVSITCQTNIRQGKTTNMRH